ncbi:MAG: peptide-methionine (S)-S-oxide reductase MsrA [Alphaproteobacteria bacterium]|nr:peptide-methionine (S)-S-oxide reductase MsrA [Alphaproteobacteria bacterium]
MKKFIPALALSLIISTFAISAPQAATAKAVFAGGCFWCMEGPFDKLKGVTATTSGYAAGKASTANYGQVSSGGTDHVEAVQITYDPDIISYATLLKTYWVNIDPFDARGQFCDKGHQYTTAIWTKNNEERQAANASKADFQKLAKGNGSFKTDITNYVSFYPAEEYHQNYYTKNPIRYKYYRGGCGRDRRLKAVWGNLASH